MRIGKVSKFGSADGLCIRAQSVLEGLQKRGHEIHAFTQAKHVKNLPSDRLHHYNGIGLNPHFYLDSLGAPKFISRVSARLGIEALHIQMNSSTTDFFLPYFKHALPPLVITFHIAYAQGHSLNNLINNTLWKISLPAAKKYDEIVLVDPAQKPIFVEKGVPEEKLHVIKNGVDTDLFSPDYERRDDDFIDFVYVGRLSIDKGIDVLIEAFDKYHNENPQSRLTLLGDGMLKFQYKNIIDRDSVRWMGSIPHEKIPEILQRCDVFVIPQNIGGLGLSVMEAMGCGLPVITTAIGETIRLLGDEEGILVEPNNRDAVVDAMHMMGNDRNRRESMGRKCREKVVKDYSWTNQISMLEEVYRVAIE